MVPIPTHWKRRFLSKGFHAASLIAQNVEKMTGIPQSQRILRAVKPTLKQGTLSRTGRLKNVRDAFVCKHPEKVEGRTVMLVDDVMTSGATMIEAARLLKRAGAKEVIVAMIARATSVD
jgi:ComF family protein